MQIKICKNMQKVCKSYAVAPEECLGIYMHLYAIYIYMQGM